MVRMNGKLGEKSGDFRGTKDPTWRRGAVAEVCGAGASVASKLFLIEALSYDS